MHRLKYANEYDDSKVKDPEELALWPHPRLIYRWQIPAYYSLIRKDIFNEGGFSFVQYYCHYRSLEEVAIKTMKLHLLPKLLKKEDSDNHFQPISLSDAKREYRLLVKLRECNRILKVIEAIVVLPLNKFLLVTERCTIDARELLGLRAKVDLSNGCGGFAFYTAVMLAAPIFQALAFIHAKGILHRDIKPDNVLIDNLGIAKLADFGLAMHIAGRTITLKHRIGTPFYFAPEIWNFKRFSYASDIWAMSMTFMEFWGGDSVHHQDNWLAVLSDIESLSPEAGDEKVLRELGFQDSKLTKLKMYVEAKQWEKDKKILKSLFRVDPSARHSAEEMKQIPEFSRALEEWTHFELFGTFQTKAAVKGFHAYARYVDKLSGKATLLNKKLEEMPEDPVVPSYSLVTSYRVSTDQIQQALPLSRAETERAKDPTSWVSSSMKGLLPRVQIKPKQSRMKASHRWKSKSPVLLDP